MVVKIITTMEQQLGLQLSCDHQQVTLFVLTLLCYSVIWLVNLIIIVTIIVDKSLHEPMYIFLCNLCINGLYGTTGFYPKFLHDLLWTTHLISVNYKKACCLFFKIFFEDWDTEGGSRLKKD
uniref:G-protein coupled receptors family 1 profile domain-containing protein n=1 Tax=Fundulus heteroclitus TaxID=8078 RepID=A0A3Q2QNG5_FUNHE